MPASVKDNSVLRLPALIVCLALVALACNLPFKEGEPSAAGGMVEGYPSSFGQGDFTEFSLSQAQQVLLSERGYPDRFSLRFFRQSQGEGRDEVIRLETWFFDEDGMEIAFQNGEAVRSRQTEPKTMDGLGRSAYRPEQFTAFIILDELVAITGQSDFYQQPLSDELVQDGQLIWMEGLTAGFKDGELIYLETIPLGQAGLTGSLARPTAAPAEVQAWQSATEAPGAPDEPAAEATLPPVTAIGGETIIMEANPGGNFDLYSVELEAGVSRNLTAHSAEDRYASCSPNGDWIAFVSDRTGNQEVYLMDRNGDNLRQVTANGTQYKDAILWLSSTELVYWDGSEASGWFITTVHGREPELVPFEQGESMYPEQVVAPDGTASLDVVRMDPDDWGDWDIFITDGAGKSNLTNSPGTADMFPVWAPDSQRFIYQSDSDGDKELYIMDRQGDILEQLTNNSHYDGTGCWLP